jgi:hypothetical protein
MSEHTPEQLRELPQKDSPWTPEETLALYEEIEGFEVVQGLPTPMYVETGADRVRWANCVRVACMTTGEPATGPLVPSMARMMFNDRETYT